MSRRADFFTDLRARLTASIGYVFETVAAACFVSFFVAILFQVFARYVIHYPVQWTEELSRLLYVAMVSLGAAVAVDEHSRLTLGLEFVKRHSRRGYQLLTLLIAWP
jgi:TRAP-type C4-dicarboxylate transport system permease small subunit